MPTAIVAVVVSVYWLAVMAMAARSWIRFRGPAGLIPKVSRERWIWLLWIPAVIAWIILPWQAWDDSQQPAEFDNFTGLLHISRYAFALLAITAFGLTVHCWFVMGANWSLAVTPRKQTSLVTRGAFGVVRHPIYALSLLLMLTTVLTVASGPILLVGLIHTAMIVAKTLSEERYLRQLHGPAYDRYCQQTGRYLPVRWLRRTRSAEGPTL
jgi:protein-S-isoprenylcysteine O-methyltransferase Ste14